MSEWSVGGVVAEVRRVALFSEGPLTDFMPAGRYVTVHTLRRNANRSLTELHRNPTAN